MSDKYKIIKSKKLENIQLEKDMIALEKKCNKYFNLQDNIDAFLKSKLPLLKYNITKLEDFLIEIAIINCVIIDENSVLLLNKFNNDFKTKVDLIGLFNQIRNIRVSTKYGLNDDSIYLLKCFCEYVSDQKTSFNNLSKLIDYKYINLDNSKYEKLHKYLNDILKLSRIVMDDLHLNLIIEKIFNLLEQKEDIIKLNKRYIYLLSHTNNKYDIELFKDAYENDIKKIKSKRL